MWSTALLVFCAMLGSLVEGVYRIPEPTITTLCPQGVQLSIPDDPTIKTVQFFLSFDRAIPHKEVGQVVNDGNGLWVYSNPSLTLIAGDKVRYQITVDAGFTCTKEGTAIISDGACNEDGQQSVPVFPVTDNLEDDSLAKTGSMKNSLKSSYSMFKTMDTKPITRSSTTVTSGSFYIKPTGEVESSGYKTASSFDSTRRDGEQWQHSKSELSQSEIDELKRIHGTDFMSLPAFAHLQELHGISGNQGSSGTSGVSGSSRSYRYSSSSSQSSGSQTRPLYGGSSSTLEEQTGQVSQDIPLSHSGIPLSLTRPEDVPLRRRPIIGTSVQPSGSYSYQSSYQRSHKTDSIPTLVNPAASFSSSDSSYIRTPNEPSNYRPINGQPTSDDYNTLLPLSSNPTYVETKYQKSEVVKTAPVATYPVGQTSSTKTETYDYTSPRRPGNPQSLTYDQTSYSGEIFHSSVRPSTPQSCNVADYGHKLSSQVDIVLLERSVNEMQCLAVLAENSVKAEIRSLKEANSNLVQRLQDLEQQFRRFRSECKCSGY